MIVSRIPPDWSGAALVVAHPDDEVLWFSSCLQNVAKVVVCFHEVRSRPFWTEGRERSIKNFPLNDAAFLRLTESEVFDSAEWPLPKIVEFGVAVSRKRARARAGHFSERLYRENYSALRTRLREQLKGYQIVLTHNPWGEYGHEEHIQVFMAVSSLQDEMGFEIWFDNYVSNKSVQLFSHWATRLDSVTVKRPTDLVLAQKLKALYCENGCWTWMPDYEWPAEEGFFRIGRGNDLLKKSTALATAERLNMALVLNYLHIEWRPGRTDRNKRFRWLQGPWRRWARRGVRVSG